MKICPLLKRFLLGALCSVALVLALAGFTVKGLPLNAEAFTLMATAQTLKLDFSEEFRTALCSTGTAGERMICGSVVNTFLTAYGAQSVFFTAEGEIIESGHVIYDFSMMFFEE